MAASAVDGVRHKEPFLSKSVSRQSSNVPDSVVPIAELMSAFPAPWALCGGWAIDAWLGRQTRDHADVDFLVFDQRALFDHLAGWQLVAHDAQVPGDTSEPWNGRPLHLPAHIHGRLRDPSSPAPDRLDAPVQQGFSLDIQLNERSGDDWIMRREPRISLPLEDSIRQSSWGVPTLVPEVLLFYKAGELRRRDKLDFLALLPQLAQEQRDWLRSAISLVGHPWLSQLSP